MIAPFHFLHQDKKVYARLIFNFEMIPDVILIIPNIPLAGIGDELFFSQVSTVNWEIVHPAAAIFPSTFANVCQQLENYFQTRSLQFSFSV